MRRNKNSLLGAISDLKVGALRSSLIRELLEHRNPEGFLVQETHCVSLNKKLRTEVRGYTPAQFLCVLIILLLALAACSPPPGINDKLPAEGNGPIIYDRGSEQGVLLLHGLTATPWEVKPFADFLASQNITVIAPLLAGHGTTEADLQNTGWEAWVKDGKDNLALLRNKTRRVYVAGESTGADIALLLAADNNVDGVILLSPAIEFQDWRAQFASVYQYILPYSEHSVVGPEIGHYYKYMPSHAVAELYTMVGHVKAALPGITVPVLILQSVADKTVKPQGADFVYANLRSKDKELRLYGNASHVLTQESDAPDVIFYSIGEFLRQH